jgi:hypothetical protein
MSLDHELALPPHPGMMDEASYGHEHPEMDFSHYRSHVGSGSHLGSGDPHNNNNNNNNLYHPSGPHNNNNFLPFCSTPCQSLDDHFQNPFTEDDDLLEWTKVLSHCGGNDPDPDHAHGHPNYRQPGCGPNAYCVNVPAVVAHHLCCFVFVIVFV